MSTLYRNGSWFAGAVTEPVLNPADQSVIAEVDLANASDVDASVQAARAAFDNGVWTSTPIAKRAQLLRDLADLLVRDKESIAALESADTGKTVAEGGYDVDDVVAVFRYYADLAENEPETRSVDVGQTHVESIIVHEPIGVCALIAPWNYPLLQISWKLAPALVAGNTVVVKPSEVTPLTTIELVKLIDTLDFPPGVVNLVLGDGPTVGAPLVAHPGVDLVSFTGGFSTGQAIMRSAADTVKKVALELGGKNPNVVFADADFEAAVDYALTAVFLHSGQVCSAGARLLVQDEIHDAFVAEVAARAARIRLGEEVGPLVSAAHRAKVEKYVASAIAEGARLVTGGGRPTEPELAQGFYFQPTIFTDCTREMTVVREETFGPILTVERFHTEEEAIFLGNDTEFGLAGAVWTTDLDKARRVASALRHGTIWINDYHPYVPQAEWGGFKKSGIGRELGPSGLAEYRETKHIWHNTTPAPQYWFKG